jgi:hypothetical protein
MFLEFERKLKFTFLTNLNTQDLCTAIKKEIDMASESTSRSQGTPFYKVEPEKNIKILTGILNEKYRIKVLTEKPANLKSLSSVYIKFSDKKEDVTLEEIAHRINNNLASKVKDQNIGIYFNKGGERESEVVQSGYNYKVGVIKDKEVMPSFSYPVHYYCFECTPYILPS